ncbi:MAG TPA: outer membrane lipoprotein carrier protein LolA [Candidatus Syntrophosphaera sp.]|jgi:outer membrane lipoprotein-sorting protein|nr:outer membrane lipoprotein carrier protein LolA [Candidatus Syntrophosphaera sp.]
MKKILLATSVWLFAAVGMYAIGSTELYAKLQSTYKNLSSFQASLQQSNYYPQLKKTITYSGNIYFTPGRMLMSFSKPNIQRLLIQGGQVEMYDAASNTLFRGKVLPEFGRMNPVEILQLYWTKSKLSVLAEDKTSASVKLVPNQDKLVSSLTATLNKNTGVVSKLSYTDKSGNTVTYNFSGIRLNAGIAAGIWNYTYPKGVQTIEQ